MRKIPVRKYLALTFIPVLILAGCGGGGGYGGGTVTPPPPPPSQVIAAIGKPNVEPITVDQGPQALLAAGKSAVNEVFVTVQVCIPGMNGASNCRTVDHVQVDSGSAGLRILSTALTGLVLPPATDGVNPLAECLPFADGSAWGSVATADLTLPVSTETASSVRLQIVGDPAYEQGNDRPSSCTGVVEDTVPEFGANGILGVGTFTDDCGFGCTPGSQLTPPPWYFGCPTPATCTAEFVTDSLQIQNPVTQFAPDSAGVLDNTGVIVELPAVGVNGAATVAGSLVFGIGTQANNKLNLVSGISVFPADVSNGDTITVVYSGGTKFPDSYLDSGSNGIFFQDSTIKACGANQMGFYCPGAGSVLSFNATVEGFSGTPTKAITFSVGDAATLFNTNSTYAAFSNLAGTTFGSTAASTVDLGLPFFYGQNVYTAIDGVNADGMTGPYFAF
jgi:hypothetical protein